MEKIKTELITIEYPSFHILDEFLDEIHIPKNWKNFANVGGKFLDHPIDAMIVIAMVKLDIFPWAKLSQITLKIFEHEDEMVDEFEKRGGHRSGLCSSVKPEYGFFDRVAKDAIICPFGRFRDERKITVHELGHGILDAQFGQLMPSGMHEDIVIKMTRQF